MEATLISLEEELRFIFLENHRKEYFIQQTDERVSGKRALASGDDPFDQLKAKAKFGTTAQELHESLEKHRTTENSESINRILVELYAIGYMLNNTITLKDDRILYYDEQINQIGKTQYEQLHKTLVEMEKETANAISGQEQLEILNERIEIAKANIEKCKELLETPEFMKSAGTWILISGAIGGLFLSALGILTGNFFIIAGGIAVIVGSAVIGGGLIIAGQLMASEAKKELANQEEKLVKLQQQRTELEKAIEEKSTQKIKELEEEARKLLGFDP